MEFKITEFRLPDAIQFNFDELKTSLIEKTEAYKHLVYTVDDIKAAKADRAELNRLKKAINDERLSKQKEYMKPFDAFKKQVDEIIAIIDEPVKIIDAQVKEFEAKIKAEKETECRKKFDELNTLDWLKYEQIADSKWLNASESISSIENAIKLLVASVEANVNSLSTLEYGFEAVEYYKRTLSVADAMLENKRLMEVAFKKAEMEKEQKSEDKAFIEVAPVDDVKSLDREWMNLRVNINEREYDALAEWLNGQGIDWSME